MSFRIGRVALPLGWIDTTRDLVRTSQVRNNSLANICPASDHLSKSFLQQAEERTATRQRKFPRLSEFVVDHKTNRLRVFYRSFQTFYQSHSVSMNN